MKKSQAKLSQLMVAGIASGILVSHLAHAANGTSDSKRKTLMDIAKETDGNITYSLMSEDDLLLQLNDEGTRIYKSLSPEGKQLALRTASRACNGTNECAGLNACATEKNKCAGQGTCSGSSKCGFSDKNLAVKVAAKKMAAKREGAVK